jgi:hypothetical protein
VKALAITLVLVTPGLAAAQNALAPPYQRALTERDPAVKAVSTWALEERGQARSGAPR